MMGDEYDIEVSMSEVEMLRYERDVALTRVAELEAEIARRDNECGRVWYHTSCQEDKVCHLPRGHTPVALNQQGCQGEPLDDDD